MKGGWTFERLFMRKIYLNKGNTQFQCDDKFITDSKMRLLTVYAIAGISIEKSLFFIRENFFNQRFDEKIPNLLTNIKYVYIDIND